MRALFLISLLSACGDADRPTALYDLQSEDLFDAPWPNDRVRDDDGTISLVGFPNPSASGFVDSYLQIAERQMGFGTNSPIYITFDDSIDTDLLPTATESLEDSSAVALFAVAPGTAYNGERIPIQWHYTDDNTSFEPNHFLAIAPQWGFPLRPNTTYALLIDISLAQRSPAFTDLLDREHPEHPLIAPFVDTLPLVGYGPEDIAVATTFTTDDPTAEMARIARFLRERVDPPVLDQVIEERLTGLFYDVFIGSIPAPLFQHGQRPYITSGGGFQFRESDGQPMIAAWENLRIAVSTPNSRQDQPEEGYPVVIYQHGTGGAFDSFANSDRRSEVAATFARAGFVGIGIDQPLHGTRATPNTDPSLHSFNYFNPESARANFRQGAIDAIWLAQALTNGPTTFTTDSGEEVRLDPERVFFMGHSQGGLTGAIAAPFLGDKLDGMVLSGAGAGLAITLVERKDPLDIAQTVGNLLDFDSNETLHELHPISGMVQMLVEVTDPINYAPYWNADPGKWDGQQSTNILLFSGINDEQTPARTGEALAIAGRLQPTDPYLPQSDGMKIRGLEPEGSTVSNNVEAWDRTVTGAFSQWPTGSHFVVFEERAAVDLYEHFLESGKDGTPEVLAR
ncbi:MAG: pimeloyl-ACP methyl ester carboxylesterase [Myxococcota bacterium]|jgi:pimeloyl-ACP methyl ester carboxylesterase